ncbi:MAG: glycosyltransferase family 2 protein [Bacteroidales bacterium]|nr:glycosyltransferase family 2 protein [Candidatus Physcousia equi]
MKSLAVLITVFNRKETTLTCLRKLYAQTPVKNVLVEVFLTDDGSTDGTSDAIRAEFPKVHIIQGDGTLFWNRGMYKAWEEASHTKDYDYYLWLNDDTHLYTTALEQLLACSRRHDDEAIIAGATVDSASQSQPTYGGRKNGRLLPADGTEKEVYVFNGNAVLVPDHVFRKLGNLDSYYAHSKGDFDYAIRARKANIKMVQAAKPVGVCDVHPHMDRWCNPDVPFKQRWAMLKRPNGMPPKEVFHLKRQESLFKASVQYCLVYLRCLFPKLWIK